MIKQNRSGWDTKIMSYVMVVILTIAMISATVAWFYYYKAAAVNGTQMTVASSDSLRVEVRQEGADGDDRFVELKEGQEDSILAYLDMPVFDNVETYEITVGTGGDDPDASDQKKTVNKMAPGVYGSFTIRLTALNQQIDHYRIIPQTLFQYVDSLQVDLDPDTGLPSATQTDANVSMLQALAKGHILFFSDRIGIGTDADGQPLDTITVDRTKRSVSEYTHNRKYAYDDQLDEAHPLTGALEWDAAQREGVPKEVTVYWYWPYEYTNLGSNIQNRIALPAPATGDLMTENRLQYFDKEKLQEIMDKTGSWSEVQLYDYADTRIGNYVEKIRFQLEVEGYHAAEAKASPAE